MEVIYMLKVKFILSYFVRLGPQHEVNNDQDVCAVCFYTNVQKLTFFPHHSLPFRVALTFYNGYPDSLLCLSYGAMSLNQQDFYT